MSILLYTVSEIKTFEVGQAINTIYEGMYILNVLIISVLFMIGQFYVR